MAIGVFGEGCILSKFYIKPQLTDRTPDNNRSCILSKFYIKPQPCFFDLSVLGVVSYRNSTSNHNYLKTHQHNVVVVSYRNSTSNHNIKDGQFVQLSVVSYRNSTSNHNLLSLIILIMQLYLIEILHQTTTYNPAIPITVRVVSYRNSTSNHNYRYVCIPVPKVVSYRNSTSNHNVGPHID